MNAYLCSKNMADKVLYMQTIGWKITGTIPSKYIVMMSMGDRQCMVWGCGATTNLDDYPPEKQKEFCEGGKS